MQEASLTRDPVTFNVAIFSCHQKRLSEKLLPLFIEVVLFMGGTIFNSNMFKKAQAGMGWSAEICYDVIVLEYK